MNTKFKKLLSDLREMRSVVVAFSGGVDSTFLLRSAVESGVRTLAVTGFSETMPESELKFAEEMAQFAAAEHKAIRTGELQNPEFMKNPINRCFHCKDELFTRLTEIARSENYSFVADGTNADDLSDWRPGREAALKHGVKSPLAEAGLSKNEIRELSRGLGLPTWSKPASPCLSSRFPYGVEITFDGLKRVELSEEFLKGLGFGELRVRSFGDVAKIELRQDEIERLRDGGLREAVFLKLKELGFRQVTVDPEGFRSGNLNPKSERA